ncbi:hypothetical protein ACSBOB_20435 [Mesorhizobium sp. ASY16-5R]|uniref:hypothetical protein n=1 Tax=Mesorhizobium sp. ASY16-5R TaxID=3445772 RepID=UPI003FA12150
MAIHADETQIFDSAALRSIFPPGTDILYPGSRAEARVIFAIDTKVTEQFHKI